MATMMNGESSTSTRKAETASSTRAAAAATSSSLSLESLPDPLQKYTNELLNETQQLPALARYDTFEAQLRLHWLEALGGAAGGNNSETKVLRSLSQQWNAYVDLCISLIEHLEQQQQLQTLPSSTDEKVDEISSSSSQQQEQQQQQQQHASSSNSNNLMIPSLRKLPFVLLEDAVGGLPWNVLDAFWREAVDTTQLCRRGGTLWKDGTGGSHVLQWIRVCNAMMMMAQQNAPPPSSSSSSSSSNGMKCRILMDLAHTLPLQDKSSIKPWGSVHHHGGGSSSSTGAGGVDEGFLLQDEQEYQEECNSVAVMAEEEAGNMSSSLSKPPQFQYSVYEAFWSLQRDFGNPYAISFSTFLQNMGTILSVMESKMASAADADAAATASSNHTTTTSTSPSSPPPLKYLTRGRTLPLQLSDPAFCLHVLTQFLIVESFISSQSQQLEASLRETTARVGALMASLRIDGERRLETLRWLLSEREAMWRQWKKNKCKPDMERSVATVRGSSTALTSEKDNDEPRRKLLPDVLRAQETILSMEDLAKVSRHMAGAVPDVFDHLQDYVDALDPEAGIDDEYHPKHDQLFRWRALRLLSRQHLPHFDMVQKSDGDFERMVRHVYKTERSIDIPGEAPEEETTQDYDVDTAAEPEKKPQGGEQEQDEEKKDESTPASPKDVEENDNDEESQVEESNNVEEAKDEAVDAREQVNTENLTEFEKAALEEEAELMNTEPSEKEEPPPENGKKEEEAAGKAPAEPSPATAVAPTKASGEAPAASSQATARDRKRPRSSQSNSPEPARADKRRRPEGAGYRHPPPPPPPQRGGGGGDAEYRGGHPGFEPRRPPSGQGRGDRRGGHAGGDGRRRPGGGRRDGRRRF